MHWHPGARQWVPSAESSTWGVVVGCVVTKRVETEEERQPDNYKVSSTMYIVSRKKSCGPRMGGAEKTEK